MYIHECMNIYSVYAKHVRTNFELFSIGMDEGSPWVSVWEL